MIKTIIIIIVTAFLVRPLQEGHGRIKIQLLNVKHKIKIVSFDVFESWRCQILRECLQAVCSMQTDQRKKRRARQTWCEVVGGGALCLVEKQGRIFKFGSSVPNHMGDLCAWGRFSVVVLCGNELVSINDTALC